MPVEPTFAAGFYKRLIDLYPRAFRERFGESMLQTFDDLHGEQVAGSTGSVRFLVWIFAETSASVVEQHLLALRNKMIMKNLISYLVLPAAVGLILVLPLIVLEYVNTNGFKTFGFPAPLYGFLWLLPSVFTILLVPTVRDLRAGIAIGSSPVSLGLRAVIMIAIVIVWAQLVNDQAPCLMGVPNCD